MISTSSTTISTGFLVFACSLVAALSPSTAYAEWIDDYSPFFIDSADTQTIYLHGPIDHRSAYMFMRAVDHLESASTVVLVSEGGDVYQALLIAREINRLGFTVVIPDGYGCFSACAFLFFAGRERISAGQLGVHQIDSVTPDLYSGQVAVADILDLFSDYGVPEEVWLEMLRTPPKEMHIYLPEDLDRMGLTRPVVRNTDEITTEITESFTVTPKSPADESMWSNFNSLLTRRYGDWQTVLYENTDTRLLFCAAESSSENGAVFRVNFYGNGDAFLEVFSPEWRLIQGPISFTLDLERYRIVLRGTAWPNALTHDFVEEEKMLAIIGALMEASSLTVRNSNGAVMAQFSLSGSLLALSALADCTHGRFQ